MTMNAPVGPPICTRLPPSSRDEEAGDDRGVETLLGLDARRDAEGDRQRQRDDADDDAGGGVARELGEAVAFLDNGEKLGLEVLY